jgi:allantoate deiminase
MGLRRDAMMAAAEMMLAIERRAATEPDLVATVGRVDVPNGATNTIPGAASFSIDIRGPTDVVRITAVRDIHEAIATISRARGVEAAVSFTYDAPAAGSDAVLTQGLASAVARQGCAVRHIPSGAGHDAMAFSGRFPFAMLFVRCRGGISHNPAEYASPADIDVAARVLADFLNDFGREG